MTINPFPGVRPFKAEEEKYYFGREAILNNILLQVQISQLTVLFARSGIGKSSFLTCRLIPEIKKGSNVAYLNEWGSDTPENLISERLNYLHSLEHNTTETDILVLDQFEDVFKFPHTRIPLWELLADIVNVSESTIHVLISMREEWFGALGEAGEFLPDALREIVRLVPLTKREIIRAIMKPVFVEGSVVITENVAELIILDLQKENIFGLGDLYVEPGMLQLVCARLWNEAHDRETKVMNIELYNELGGANKISRDYIWKHLGDVRIRETEFSFSDRVLWCGITNQLIAMQGVKSIVSANSISKTVKLTDFGIAGSAIISKRLRVHVFASKANKDAFKYIQLPIGKRDADPPAVFVEWVDEVLAKGIRAGFLKRQSSQEQGGTLVELSHDTLGDILQKFSVAHENWIFKRVYALFYGFLAFTCIMPLVVYRAVTSGIYAALREFLFLGGFLLLYIVVLFLFMKIFNFIFSIIGYPIIRWLCKGQVPDKDILNSD